MITAVTVVTAPNLVVTVAEAKAHLRVDASDHDTQIEAFIAAAIANLDGPAGWLGRSIGSQVLNLVMDHTAFGRSSFRVPSGPVITLTSVKYIDTDGVEQTLAAETYTLLVDGRVALAYNQSWPSVRCQSDAVRVRYTAGYAAVPAPIKAAILMMVADMYANREAQMAADMTPNPTVDALLGPYRVWSL